MKCQKTNVKKKKPLKIATPKIKYLRLNLTKEVKDLNAENYNTLIKLKVTQRNGIIAHALGLEELILLKWP